MLINNAGITKDNLAIRMHKDEWDKVLDINLTSTFLLTKFAIKKMLKKKSGKIIDYWEGIKEEREFKKAIDLALVL